MFKSGGLKVAKIPGNEKEALKSSLLNLLQKKNLI
jgi:RAB protein geranylgeranyltransferase component A